MIRFIAEARTILTDNKKRRKYDNGVAGISGMVKCYNHLERNDIGKLRTDVTSDIVREDKAIKLECRYFCSNFCRDKFIHNDVEGTGRGTRRSSGSSTPKTGPSFTSSGRSG